MSMLRAPARRSAVGRLIVSTFGDRLDYATTGATWSDAITMNASAMALRKNERVPFISLESL